MRNKTAAGLCVLFAAIILLGSDGGSISVVHAGSEPLSDIAQNDAIAQLRKEVSELKEAELHEETEDKKSYAWKLGFSVLASLVALLLIWLLKIGVGRFEDFVSEKGVIRESAQTLRLKTLSKIFNWAGAIFILLLLLYVVLDTFGVNVAPLLAGAGIIGVALGFGGQYLIRDLINGVFILVEGQFGVNDIVRIGEHAGVVEDVNLRTTTLRDMEGRVIVIPNGEIKVVINMTKDFAQAVLNIGIAYKENVDRVMEVIMAIGQQIRTDPKYGPLILGDMEMLGVDGFGESEVTLRCRIKTLPTKQWEISRELRRRIKNRFDELGIEIPFPHRTLYWGKDQKPTL